LARIYVEQKHDRQAIGLLNSILLANSASRNAKLELAQIFGYRENYKESDRLYRELLTASPDDEAASLGLVHNLTLEGKRAEARAQLQQAFARHPTVFSCSNTVIIYHQGLLKASRSRSTVFKTPNPSLLILQATALFTPAREWSTSSPGISPAVCGWMKLLSGRPAPSLKRFSPEPAKRDSDWVSMPLYAPAWARCALPIPAAAFFMAAISNCSL